MAPEDPGNPSDRPDANRPRRRPRYAGTHPRRFNQRYKELRPEAYPEMQTHIRAKGGTPAGTHIPVLVAEVLECLDPRPGEIVADCTLGYGGHAIEFLKRIGPTGRLVGFDVDADQLERTRQRLADSGAPPLRSGAPPPRSGGRNPKDSGLETSPTGQPAISLHHSNFAGIGKALREERLDGYDIIFADLGVSSMQVDDPARGFSYKHDGPLDMRMDPRLRRTAADLLASLSADELSAALRDLADEPDHERIAAQIVRQRATQPIARTLELVSLIFEAKGTTRRDWRKHADPADLHPAARTFQALRILVNDELAALTQLLREAPYCLRPGGRIGIITFHSGEDRLVKQSFRDGFRSGTYAAIAEEVIRPTPRERRDNPRSSPAKLRWARKPR